MYGEINRVSLDFKTFRQLNIIEARKFIVELEEEYLEY